MCNFQSCWITLLDWKLLEKDEIINYLEFTESLWTTYIRCEADEVSSWMEISWENNTANISDTFPERRLTVSAPLGPILSNTDNNISAIITVAKVPFSTHNFSWFRSYFPLCIFILFLLVMTHSLTYSFVQQNFTLLYVRQHAPVELFLPALLVSNILLNYDKAAFCR